MVLILLSSNFQGDWRNLVKPVLASGAYTRILILTFQTNGIARAAIIHKDLICTQNADTSYAIFIC